MKISHSCNPTLQTYEGGVGERRTEGLRVSCRARWRDAEVDEGAVLCFLKVSDHGRNLFFSFSFSFLFFLALLFRLMSECNSKLM